MLINSSAIKNSINTNLPSNDAGLIVATIMRATLILLVDWISLIIAGAAQVQNIAVENILTESLISHSLDTMKVNVAFFQNNRLVNNIDWEPVSNSQIKIYLSYSDTPIIDTFTGEIFITKRG